jgi:hypothetical protein
MKQLQGLEKRIRGWIPKEPQLSNAAMAAQAPVMSERDKAIRLKVLSVLLGAIGVCAGGGIAARTYLYSVVNGVTSCDATVYSAVVWVCVIAVFWVGAFKLKKIQQYITKEA